MYEKIIEYLNNCAEKDILSHAYIFYGPDDLSKKNIAKKFVNKILDNDAKLHPDFFFIGANNNEERSINMIRQVKKFLTLSPYAGKYKIVMIDAVHKLNSYSQNALLKIFEEAPSHAIIIFFAKTIDSIPPTISSRGVKLPFWKQNKTDLPKDEKIIEIFNEMLNETSKNRYRAIQGLNAYKTVEIFELWLEFLRNKFLFDPTKKLADILKVSQNIYFKLSETNINPKFAYDELILNL